MMPAAPVYICTNDFTDASDVEPANKWLNDVLNTYNANPNHILQYGMEV